MITIENKFDKVVVLGCLILYMRQRGIEDAVAEGISEEYAELIHTFIDRHNVKEDDYTVEDEIESFINLLKKFAEDK